MPIAFKAQETLAFIAKTIAVAAAAAAGAPQPTSERYGDLLEILLKNVSITPSEKPIDSQLNDTIQDAVDQLFCSRGFELPADCAQLLRDAFSAENALRYLQSSDPHSEFYSAIKRACQQSKDCDISTLPLEQITEEMLKHVYDAIVNHHEFTALVSLAQNIDINRKLDKLIALLQSILHQEAEHRDPMDCLAPAFREYVKESFAAYQERNIEVATPQLLAMALRCPGNRALEILDCFDAGGKHSGPYGAQLLHFLDQVDAYYSRSGRVYSAEHYPRFQHRLRTWIGNSENACGCITPVVFTYFVLQYSDGQTVQKIKTDLGNDYAAALSYIRNDQLPSFPGSFE